MLLFTVGIGCHTPPSPRFSVHIIFIKDILFIFCYNALGDACLYIHVSCFVICFVYLALFFLDETEYEYSGSEEEEEEVPEQEGEPR